MSFLEPRHSFKHYRILNKIGAGGMGEVYLAHDEKLDRKVALKILPAEVAADRKRMNRFVQEAKAASALNHPNIITIHEIDQTESGHFIATEFIEGETLRARMKNEGMKMSNLLSFAIQTADALAAAHEAGIIHRDIKPENIMLRRRDSIVKVLDFGLAKLTERLSPESVDTEAPTSFKTDPGTVVGTVFYMSPEQARGIAVDARTDIWSLGVVVYEMVAGSLPFADTTASGTLAAILNEKEAPPLARFSREVPAELERIVEKALRKDRQERYQTAKDMLLDLKRLKQKLEVEAEIERTAPPEQFGVPPSGGPLSAAKSLPLERGAPSTHPTRSTEYIVSEIKRHKAGASVALGAFVIALAVAGYFYFPRASKGPIDSIAVLPLVNTSNDPNAQYLSDGITDSLIASLSQLPNLKVMSHNSVFHYKGPEVNVQDVANKLGVRAVLTGRLAQVDDNLVINVELVDAQDNRHLWGEQYNRKFSDILKLQSEIAQEISRQLRTKLTTEDQTRVSKSYTASIEAYQVYLKGRYYWYKFTENDFKRALEYFQQAIDKDPNYALAYAGMADCYWQLGWYGYLPKKEAWPKAKAAIEKGLERDKTVAEVHTSLANFKIIEGDYDGAEVEFKQALSLKSSDAQTHMQYSWYLDGVGQVEKAIEQAQKAYELDPLSVAVVGSLGQAFFFGRRYDEAIKVFQEVLRSDPNSSEVHAYLGSAFEQKHLYDEAIKEFQKARDFSVEKTGIGMLGHAYAVSGRTSEARKILDQLLKETPVQSYAVALVYSGLGDKDSTFVWLNKTLDVEDNRNQLLFIKVDPVFDNLRTDQRFTELLRRMKLPT